MFRVEGCSIVGPAGIWYKMSSADLATSMARVLNAMEQLDGDKPLPEKTSSWPQDVHAMHEKFGHLEAVSKMDDDQLDKLMQFRLTFLKEEMDELVDAALNDDTDGIVDAIIDWIVVGIGTLDLFNVDVQKAWDTVHAANMSKISGVNPNRHNPTGLPDLSKPAGWKKPDHSDNVGLLSIIF